MTSSLASAPKGANATSGREPAHRDRLEPCRVLAVGLAVGLERRQAWRAPPCAAVEVVEDLGFPVRRCRCLDTKQLTAVAWPLERPVVVIPAVRDSARVGD